MGLSALAIKVLAKTGVGKFVGKAVVGMSLFGNALLPKFMRNALHIQEEENVAAPDSVPIYLDLEVWLLIGLICFALVVTQEKKEEKKKA